MMIIITMRTDTLVDVSHSEVLNSTLGHRGTIRA
jgi:hypothetical protein